METETATPPAPTTPDGTSTPAAEEATPSTTEQLFPDFFVGEGDQRQITMQRQEMPPPPEKPAEPPKPAEPEVPPAEPAAKGPEYLDLSQISGKLVKVKVDGVETDVPAEELVKNYQLDRHLTQRGQSLAAKEKELKQANDELLAAQREAAEAPPPPAGTTSKPDTRVEAALKKVAELEAAIKPVVTKEKVDAGLERLDRMVRANLGFEDFKAKIPEVRAEIAKQVNDPNNPTEEELARYDT